MGAITGIGKDDSYLKWLQAQKNGANSIMFRSQQNPPVDAEKVQAVDPKKAQAVDAKKLQPIGAEKIQTTGAVKPAEQTSAPFGIYTIPGIEATPGVKMPTFKQPLHRVASEDGSAQIGYTNSKGAVGCTEFASGYINGLGKTEGLGENGQLKLRDLYA